MWRIENRHTDRESNYRGQSNPDGSSGWAGQYYILQLPYVEALKLNYNISHYFEVDFLLLRLLKLNIDSDSHYYDIWTLELISVLKHISKDTETLWYIDIFKHAYIRGLFTQKYIYIRTSTLVWVDILINSGSMECVSIIFNVTTWYRMVIFTIQSLTLTIQSWVGTISYSGTPWYKHQTCLSCHSQSPN